ncbi:MAG TPA: hypothetical protein VH477_17335 [Bryobacteraceae bacterium]
MNFKLANRLIAVLGAVAVPVVAGTIEVNGTCVAGTCGNPDVLAYGGSNSNPFRFVYTFANSDRYQMTGTLSAINNVNPASGGTWEINAAQVTVSYLGNNSNTASGTDTMVVDFLQLFQSPAAGSNNNVREWISGTFGGPLANASSAQGQALTAGTAARILGPFFPPGNFSDSAINQPGSYTAGATLLDFKDTLTFGAGSGIGSTIYINNVPGTAVPEPGSWPVGALFAMLFVGSKLVKSVRQCDRGAVMVAEGTLLYSSKAPRSHCLEI